MKIEPATLDDIPELVDLIHGTFRGDGDLSKLGWCYDCHLISGPRITPEMIRHDITRDNTAFLKCSEEDTGKIVACVFGEKKEDVWFIGTLTVNPSLQKCGLGGKLMNLMEEMGKERGCSRVKIVVVSARDELIAWYERKGYTKNGERDIFPDDGRYGIAKIPLEFVALEKSI